MTPEFSLLQAALERQIAVLAPIAQRLRLAVAHPPIAPHDWRGPASRSYETLEQQLRSGIRDAEAAVLTALHDSRLAIGQSAAQVAAQAAAQVSAQVAAQPFAPTTGRVDG